MNKNQVVGTAANEPPTNARIAEAALAPIIVIIGVAQSSIWLAFIDFAQSIVPAFSGPLD